MEGYKDFSIHDERQNNKWGLRTYFHNKINVFDIAVDKLIEQRKIENKKNDEEYVAWINMEKNDPVRYAELKEDALLRDIDISVTPFSYIMDSLYNEQEIFTLIEMKIICAFKFLEIHIKNLLAAAFPSDIGNELYKWDILGKYLKSKNIDIKKLEGYEEINQLKDVNNLLKHTDDFKNKLAHISEFNSSSITHIELELFYDRIKSYSNKFCESLVTAIEKELYEFDTDKITEIANSLLLRMEKDDVKKLIQEIEKHL